MHEGVVLVEHHGAVDELELDVLVEYRAAADGQRGGVHRRAYQQKRHPDPAVEGDLAQAKDAEHDDQQQIAPDHVGQPVGHQGFLQRGGAGQQGVAQVDHGHQHVEHGDVRVEVLVPHEHVDQRHDDRRRQHQVVV